MIPPCTSTTSENASSRPGSSSSAPRQFLGVRTGLDEARASALWPDLDLEGVRDHLSAIERIARGDPGAGPIAQLDTTARFHWLTAPSSTIIQPSEVHAGICSDPELELDELYAELVAATPPS